MTQKLFTLLICLMLSASGYAQSIDTAKLNTYFSALEQNNKFMGSVAVSRNGTIIYSKRIGYADIENNLKADGNSKYRIGSLSKTFTAVLIMKAVEEKKIGLDKTVETFFPSLPNASKITIRQLLNHHSGIHDFTEDDDYLSWNTKPKTEQEMIAIITKGGSDFEPGSKAAYSNSNYVLLTFILEKKYGKSFKFILEEKIAKPLKLKNTYLGGKISTKSNECSSYAFVDGWKIAPETDISIPLGAGGIISTPTDLLQFSDALFRGKLLKIESLEQMKTMQDNIGLGLFQIPFDDKISYGHRGGIDKFTSVFSYFQDDKISFALSANGNNYDANEIPLTVLNAVFGKDFEIPDFSTYAVSTEELDLYPGVYASPKLPIKITISKEGANLIAQATGQQSMVLEATAKNKFRFAKAGIMLEFHPTEKTMLLKQAGNEFLFSKE